MTGRRSSGSPKDKHRRKIQKKEKMNDTKYMVYWTMTNGAPASMEIGSLTTALSYAELHRRQGMRFVTMCAEDPNQVGKMGVDSIVDNKTPDGVEYTWVKRRDGGQ